MAVTGFWTGLRRNHGESDKTMARVGRPALSHQNFSTTVTGLLCPVVSVGCATLSSAARRLIACARK